MSFEEYDVIVCQLNWEHEIIIREMVCKECGAECVAIPEKEFMEEMGEL